MFNDSDIAVRETDFDALSSRLSCYLKNYNPEDELLLDIVPLLLHYTILEIQSDFKRFAVSRKLKSQFFNLFPTNLIDLQKILDLNTSLVRSRINRFTPLKSPMINRGTYLRTKSISDNIQRFISTYSNYEKIQIISLGAGNDTRPFNLLPNNKNLHYFEIDFDFTTKLKKLAILSSQKISSKIDTKSLPIDELPDNSESIKLFDPILNTSRYHLIPFDLRNLNPNISIDSIAELSIIDSNCPTLVISECCICYLSQIDSNNVIKFWTENLNNGEFLIYEPLGGSDTFTQIEPSSKYGEVMVKNLICRGIEMPTLMIYGTVESQIQRFETLLKNTSIIIPGDSFSVWCKDMKWVYDNQLDSDEIDRISRLEMLDEMEELNLINSHYCLIIAKWVKEKPNTDLKGME